MFLFGDVVVLLFLRVVCGIPKPMHGKDREEDEAHKSNERHNTPHDQVPLDPGAHRADRVVADTRPSFLRRRRHLQLWEAPGSQHPAGYTQRDKGSEFF